MYSDVEMMVFMEELEEKIQAINDNVLLMERSGGSPEVIQEIFRAAHTIKGSSGVMGYEKMMGLTHEIENLFDRLRQGTMEITTALIDILFESLDFLKLLKDEITGDAKDVSVDAIMAKLKAFQDKKDASSSAGDNQGVNAYSEVNLMDSIVLDLIREAEFRGFQAFIITVNVSKECQMKNIRAFLVYEGLQHVGEILKSNPSVEDIEAGNYGDSFSLVYISQEDVENIKNVVMSISEIDSVDIVNLDSNEIVISSEQDEVAPGREEGKAPGTDSPVAQVAAGMEKTTIKTVRVDVQKLDTLMNLVSELVIDRTRLVRFVDIFENKFGSEDLVENIIEISNHLGQITGDLQEEIMKARMLPVATVFNRMPRMVRDIAQKLGKEIDFVIEGQETELDRNVIEVIGDPLIHLIRNSIDHGIEDPDERERLGKPRIGQVTLKASYVESHIVITLSDDGKGIDVESLKNKALEKGLLKPEALSRMSKPEILDLIFKAGFSTVEKVSDVSGRGVGMDIVRNQIEQISGTVEFNTEVGKGTVFYIRLPLTLVIVRALMVGMGESVYAFPLPNVMETLSIHESDIKLVGRSEVIVVRGGVLPIVRMSEFFMDESIRTEESIYVVVLGFGNRRVGIIVDKLVGEQEIVIKSLGSYLGQIAGISGATILGDGRVALIIDAKGIIKDSNEDLPYAN
ncbi:MAG: chemotaxis protein CheA [Peptococcaceae bacterium]|nr:chemotaxis protein CheA [Peptococcaceae bacterium]